MLSLQDKEGKLGQLTVRRTSSFIRSINCGMPNFSTTFFNSTIPELSNTYSELEISNDSENESTDNIGLPTYTSSPIQLNQTQSSSTTKKKQGKNKKDTHTSKNSEPQRVFTKIIQSIKNKKPEVLISNSE
jgi:hypothetical protein